MEDVGKGRSRALKDAEERRQAYHRDLKADG